MKITDIVWCLWSAPPPWTRLCACGSYHTSRPTLCKGRGNVLYGGYFAVESFVGGLSRHPWNSQSSNCLTHTGTCKPMLRSESERCAHPIATESGIGPHHLKEPAHTHTQGTHNNWFRKGTGRKSALHCRHPSISPGEIFAAFLKVEISPRNHPRPTSPPPPVLGVGGAGVFPVGVRGPSGVQQTQQTQCAVLCLRVNRFLKRLMDGIIKSEVHQRPRPHGVCANRTCLPRFETALEAVHMRERQAGDTRTQRKANDSAYRKCMTDGCAGHVDGGPPSWLSEGHIGNTVCSPGPIRPYPPPPHPQPHPRPQGPPA